MLKIPNSHVISNTIEHPAVIKVLKHLKPLGLDYSLVKVDKNGLVSLNELDKCITPKTRLVSVMMSNNEIGTIQPIKSIMKLIRDKNILMHTSLIDQMEQIQTILTQNYHVTNNISGHYSRIKIKDKTKQKKRNQKKQPKKRTQKPETTLDQVCTTDKKHRTQN